MKDKELTKKIFMGFALGIFFGVTVNFFSQSFQSLSTQLISFLNFGGDFFLKILKMMVVPVVFFSLISGVSNLTNLNSLGRIGLKSLSLYLTTTFLAITISLMIANHINPGISELINNKTSQLNVNEPPSIMEIILNIIPENPFNSLSEGNMLQVIVFAILIGSGISLVDKNDSVTNIFNDLNKVIMKILGLVMVLAPVGIFCLISKTFATQGLSTILELFKYFFVVVFCLFIHVFVVYIPIIKVLGKTKVIIFFKGIKEAILFAFSTSSSSATIPITLENLKKNLSVKNKICSFTVPLGATINMDGTAIMQGVATVFIANLYGYDLLFSDFISIIVTATLASIGTAGVPGVGIIMLGMVLNQVGLPLEGIAIIMGVDRFLDMLRTSVNVTGDAMVSIVIDKNEKI